MNAVRQTFAFLALAGACLVTPVRAQEPKHGGTLVIGTTQAARTLNGAIQSGFSTAIPGAQLFASPLRFDDHWNPQPYLAEAWELAPDGRSLTLHLRHGAVFHDGQPITSADVAFSIMAIKANHPFQSMLAPVTAVDTPDPYTAIVRMSAPHPAIVLAMSPPLCPIMPKHIYGTGDLKTQAHNTTDVVGSGPFKLVEFQPGKRIVMTRFDKFFLPGRPYLDKIIVDVNPDDAALILGMERGDYQMLPFVGGSADLKRLAKDPDVVETEHGYEGAGALNWLDFNLARKPLSDLAVRRAIATTIDKNFITKVLMGGMASVSDGPIVASSPFASTDLTRYPLDLDKARSMLDAAGYKAGPDGERFKLTIDYLPGVDEQQKNVAEYIRSQLKKVGIRVDLRASADFANWAARMASHDFDMSMDSVFNWGDPVIGVHRTYLSTNILPIVWTNTQSYRNPEVDKWLNAAATEVDAVKRRADYARFQKIVTDELPILFINTTPYHTVASTKLQHLPESIWGPMSPFDELSFK